MENRFLLGSRLRETRQKLNLSQDEMAAGVISRSFYSRVEGNKHKITAVDLLEILPVHQIPILEFLAGFGETNPRNRVYQDRAVRAYINKDESELKKIILDQDFNNLKIKTTVELMLAELGHSVNKFSKKSVNLLKYNLLELGNWDVDALWIFSNSMILYDFSDLRGMVDLLFRINLKDTKVSERSMVMLANIAISYLNICYGLKHTESEMVKASEFLKKMPNSSEIALQKIIGVFFDEMNAKHYKEAKKIIVLLLSCGCEKYLNK